MSMGNLRADGWQDAVAFLVMAVVAAVFWYANDLYVNWPVIVAGAVCGAIVYRTYDAATDHPVAGFVVTISVVVAMLAALFVQSLVGGVVAALTVTTVLKTYEVYS